MPRSSLTSGLDILELLDSKVHPLRLTDIACELSMSKANAHQTLAVLCKKGVVQRLDSRAYRLAPLFHFWGKEGRP